jgi:hypothetical protein
MWALYFEYLIIIVPVQYKLITISGKDKCGISLTGSEAGRSRALDPPIRELQVKLPDEFNRTRSKLQPFLV